MQELHPDFLFYTRWYTFCFFHGSWMGDCRNRNAIPVSRKPFSRWSKKNIIIILLIYTTIHIITYTAQTCTKKIKIKTRTLPLDRINRLSPFSMHRFLHRIRRWIRGDAMVVNLSVLKKENVKIFFSVF